MLSRVADSICWMSRYIERAENVARFVDVNLHLMLDSPRARSSNGSRWSTPPATTSCSPSATARPPRRTSIQFLTFDPEYPNSILSCLRAARENARSIREIISSEMWEQVNRFYLMVKEAANDLQTTAGQHKFFTEVKQASHLFSGIAEATMTRNEAWHFLRLGRMLERADKTSRILDVKYFMLLRSAADVGTPFDDVHWAAVLRSASAFEMYRKRHGRISPEGIVAIPAARSGVSARDPLLPEQRPRIAARHLRHAAGKRSRTRRNGSWASSVPNSPTRNIEDVIQGGLHEYLDDLQTKMNQVSQGIYDTFFARRMPESGTEIHAPAQPMNLPTAADPRSESACCFTDACPFTSPSTTGRTIAMTGRSCSGRRSSGCGPRRTAAPAS